jgi:16S rRNA (adenine1518-N6/adenine1519-N6)-dimethyltransferase
VRARQRFAQHFLEPAWVRKLVERIEPTAGDGILEIGAGRGALTRALAPLVCRLVAVEIDRDLAAALATGAPANVGVVEGDVLRVDLGAIADALAVAVGPQGRVRVVGNLPYNISSPILFRLLGLARAGAPVHDAIVMLQREVADRVTAEPGTGDWGPLAACIQLRADVRRLLALPPGAFRPAPAVQSAVLRLEFRAPRVAVGDEALFGTLVRALFGQRRKTVLNALRAFAATYGHDAAGLLAAASIAPGRRPETLNLAELAALTAAVTRPSIGGTLPG